VDPTMTWAEFTIDNNNEDADLTSTPNYF
jgi:hypothetical protein